MLTNDLEARIRPDEKVEADVNPRHRGTKKKLSSRNKRHPMMRGKKNSKRR